jgi:hypothetical protein
MPESMTLPQWVGRLLGLVLVGLVAIVFLFAGWIGALIVAAVCGAIIGAIAQARGREFGDWFIYGFLVAPIALIHVLAAGRSTAGLRKCPACAEMVKAEATICRYCHQPLPAAIEPPMWPSPDQASWFKTREEYEAWRTKQAGGQGRSRPPGSTPPDPA